MNKREIITLMHRLFYGDIDISDGYQHLYVNDELDESKYSEFIQSYIRGNTILIYVNSQEAIESNIKDSYLYVKQHMKKLIR